MQLLCVLQQQTHCLAPYMDTLITGGDSIPIPFQQSLSTMQQLASYPVPTLGKKWKLKLKIRLGYIRMRLVHITLPFSLLLSSSSFIILHLALTLSPVLLGLPQKASLSPVSLSSLLFCEGLLPTDAHSCSTEEVG